jgi:hypothetical protein
MGMVNAMKIKVYRTITSVLNRVTLRREYAYITTKVRLNNPKKFGLIRLTSSDEPSINNYIYVGNAAYSRERFDHTECLMDIRKVFPSLKDGDISFPDINELYRLSEGKILEIDVEGNSIEDVNRTWVFELLQFNVDKFHTNDFVSVKITLSKIAGRRVRNEGVEPVDAASFEVYDRMIDVFLEIDKNQAYGDACSIEYSIISDGYEYRYFITHFFSNHNWSLDPHNLLNICFTAEVINGTYSKENVRFSHPSKITSRKTDGTEFLIEAITMDNSNVSVKFRNGDTKEPSKVDASRSRIYDNPVDFSLWVDLYYQEIRML